ncbi:MAG TPA: diguanylate cyclase [Anaerolineales bacterium]
MSASLGISLYPQDGCDAETLLNLADADMYRVKMRGKNS